MGHLHRADRRSRRGALKIRGFFRLSLTGSFIAAVVASNLAAQPVEPAGGGEFERPPQVISIAPVYEGGVRKNRGIHIPVNLRSDPERRVSFGYTVSNSYLNPGFLVCADRSCQLEYESDHTGNLLFATITQPVLERFELGFTVGTYRMNNIPGLALLHQLASDDAVESFHKDILSEESLPSLSNAPEGRQVFTMTDIDGRRLSLEPEHHYALPLRIDLTRYVEIRSTGRSDMSLNLGAHLSYPLEGDVNASEGAVAFSRGIDLGVSANFIRSRRITANVSSTFHLQLARFRSEVHVVNTNSPLSGDDRLRSQYALTYGLRFDGTFASRAPCSFAMSQVTNSAHYDKKSHWTWDPLVFEGGNNLRGAILGANDYGILSFGCAYRERQFQLSLVEDFGGFSQFFSDDGSGTSYDPDFAVGLAVSWNLDRSRNGRN